MLRRLTIPIVILIIVACIPLFIATNISSEDYWLHEFHHKQLSTEFYCEGATFGDVTGDENLDLISGPFVYEAPLFETSITFYEPIRYPISTYSDCFFYFVDDFNQDGLQDIFRIGFPGKEASWYQNPGAGSSSMWTRHIVFEGVDNESPTYIDLTGDGHKEMVLIHEGRYGYALPDREMPEKPWTFIPVSEDRGLQKYTHGLGYGDVNGDGRVDILEATGWYEQPASLNGNPLWSHHPYEFAAGGAQMYAYDFDGDGDNDVITGNQAHAWGLLWHENISTDGKVEFKKHVIMGETPEENDFGIAFSQLHAIDLVDMDGDGIKDIITGKRFWAHMGKDPGGHMPPVIYWFKTVRSASGDVTFIPHFISNATGVGTQLVVKDYNGDQLPDIAIGNKKGIAVYTHSKRAVSHDEWEDAQPKLLSP